MIQLHGTNKVEITTRYGKFEISEDTKSGQLVVRETSGSSIHIIPKASNTIVIDGFKESKGI